MAAMNYLVSNPTFRKKAVRIGGGFRVLPPGATAEVSAAWDDAEIERYRSAGLEIKKAEPKKVEVKAAEVKVAEVKVAEVKKKAEPEADVKTGGSK